MTAPTPFPHEDPEHQLPPVTRPRIRRPVEDDTWDPTPYAPYPAGDPIKRAVITAAFVIVLVFFGAAMIRGRYTPHVILGCIFAGLAVCGVGALAYRFTDRKAGQP